MTRFGLSISVVLFALASLGCEEGRTPPPNVPVTVVHAAPTYGALDFFRGASAKTAASNMNYRNALGGLSFNADTYNFSVNVAATDPGIGEVLASFAGTLNPDNTYHVVIAEAADGDLAPLLVEQAAFPTDSTNAEVTLVSTAETFGSVDVYLETAGTALASAVSLGTAAFRDNLAPVTRAPGSYSLFLTAVGDPSTVLFETAPFTLVAGRAELIVLTDGAGEGLAELVAVHVNNVGTGLSFNLGVQTGIRLINAVGDRAARDVYLDEDFTTPLVAALAFAAPTAYETVAPGAHDVSFTPTGNASVVEGELSQTFGVGRLYTAVAAGESGDVDIAATLEDHRPLRDTAHLQFINGAGMFDNVEFYVAEPDTDIATIGPVAVTAAPAISVFSSIPPAEYELTVVDAATDAVLAGPIALSIDAGGFYSVLALDAVGGATVDVQLLDDFN